MRSHLKNNLLPSLPLHDIWNSLVWFEDLLICQYFRKSTTNAWKYQTVGLENCTGIGLSFYFIENLFWHRENSLVLWETSSFQQIQLVLEFLAELKISYFFPREAEQNISAATRNIKPELDYEKISTQIDTWSVNAFATSTIVLWSFHKPVKMIYRALDGLLLEIWIWLYRNMKWHK